MSREWVHLTYELWAIRKELKISIRKSEGAISCNEGAVQEGETSPMPFATSGTSAREESRLIWYTTF